MNKKFRNELKNAFDIPEPLRREEFLEQLPYPKESNFELFKTQITYISKSFYALSCLFVSLIIIFISDASEISFISSSLPFLSLIAVMELEKSLSYKMDEMEMACRNNLSKIVLIRLSVIGLSYFIIFVIAFLIAVDKSGYGLLKNLIYLFTPFLVSSNISLLISNKFRTNKEVIYVCAAVTGVVCVTTSVITMSYQKIYALTTNMFSIILFILLNVLLFVELRKLIKKMKNNVWSLEVLN